MPVKFKISVVLVGKSLKITIPKEVAEHLDIKKGDAVELWVDNSHMILEKLEKRQHVDESERKERQRKRALVRREAQPTSVPSRERSYF